MIHLDSLATFTEAYPDAIARFTHAGDEDPLFEIPRLAILAAALPRSHTRLVGADQDTLGAPQMPPTLLVQGAPGLRNDLRLLAVDRDPDYDALVNQVVRPLGPLSCAAGAPIGEVESRVAIVSPGLSSGPCKEPEAHLILQCRGARAVSLDPDADGPSFSLTPGTAAYLPAHTPYQLDNGDETSVSLEMTLIAGASRPAGLFERLKALFSGRRG